MPVVSKTKQYARGKYHSMLTTKGKCFIFIVGLIAIGELFLGIFEGSYIEKKPNNNFRNECTYINEQILVACIIDITNVLSSFWILIFFLCYSFWLDSKNKNNSTIIFNRFKNKAIIAFIVFQIPQIIYDVATFVLYYYYFPCYDVDTSSCPGSSTNIPEYYYYVIIHYVIGWSIVATSVIVLSISLCYMCIACYKLCFFPSSSID
jgi:hypothetical protein